jgi:ubiquinone biosynthesis protein COQ9
MNDNNTAIKDKILTVALEDAAFDGWNADMVQAAAEKAGYERAMAKAVFPDIVTDILVHLSDWADRQMLEKLEEIEPESMRVRDRIRLAVQTRLSVLKDHKESVKASSRYWLHPFRKFQAAKMVWSTADCIWDWAGDTATDYNRYTKRGLLSGVLTSTMLYWMNDDSENQEKTLRFLDSRIENVMQLGKVISTVKSRVKPTMKPGQGAA